MSDNAIEILKEIHANMETEVPFRMVEIVYETEKKFLFEKDGSKSLAMVKQIVENYVDNQSR
jgi:hypothetical protein